jgi:hypothetical protein
MLAITPNYIFPGLNMLKIKISARVISWPFTGSGICILQIFRIFQIITDFHANRVMPDTLKALLHSMSQIGQSDHDGRL